MNAPFGQKSQTPVTDRAASTALSPRIRRCVVGPRPDTTENRGACQDRDVAVPQTHEHQIARWCQERVPDAARDQVRLEYQVRGSSVTIVERRAPWRPDFGPDWTSRPIAQLRYASTTWRLYWPDRNTRWHLIPDVPAAASPAALLAVIADPASGFE